MKTFYTLCGCNLFYFVLDPPEVKVLRSWVNSGEGLEAKLDCVVHSDPPAEVWLYQRITFTVISN